MLSLKQWKNQRTQFEAAGIQLPAGDVDAVRTAGKGQPSWIHVGGGNLYRAFHAAIAQDLIDAGKLDRGVVVFETHRPFTVDELYHPFNCDILQVVMKSDGSLSERVLSSTADALFANVQRPEDWERAKSFFRSPVLQLVTVTITEKGYGLRDADGSFSEQALADFSAGPAAPTTTMATFAALLLERFNAGAAPIAMVSTDNFSRNGEHFRSAVLDVAQAWQQAGHVGQEFVDYVSDESRVSFPWTMIDRITPNPSTETEHALAEQGFSDLPLISAGRSTFAGFSNTEEAHYLVVEDSFPNGRPDLTAGGVILCDRTTAEAADTMKVTACLNPLHTTLAVYGCLLGYTRIWQEMENPDLASLVRHIGYDEDLPVVVDPKVIDPKSFIDELLTHRLPNRALPDAPQRIATDTSQKVPVRFGHTLAAYQASPSLDPASLTYIPLAIAGWLRYLLGVDDAGNAFEPSPDPLLAQLQAQLSSLSLGCTDAAAVHDAVAPILSNKEIFVVDLYEVGLGEKVEGMLLEELTAPGAVATTIKKYI
jgi:fructuronate reductase